MKLVLAIVGNDDASTVIPEINRAGFFVTKLSSSGGFLRAGNTVLMIGIEDENIPDIFEILSMFCKKRSQITPSMPTYLGEGIATSLPIEISVGGATVFVLDVESFEKV